MLAKKINMTSSNAYLKRSLISMMWILFISHSQYALASAPHGCKQAGYQFKHYTLILNPQSLEKQSLYFVRNRTMSTVNLYHMRNGEEPYVLYLNNRIKPNQWGALATDESQVKFICTTPAKKDNYGTIKDCQTMLDVCEYTNVVFSTNNHGNYWAVGSNSKRETIRKVIRQGVFLRW